MLLQRAPATAEIVTPVSVHTSFQAGAFARSSPSGISNKTKNRHQSGILLCHNQLSIVRIPFNHAHCSTHWRSPQLCGICGWWRTKETMSFGMSPTRASRLVAVLANDNRQHFAREDKKEVKFDLLLMCIVYRVIWTDLIYEMPAEREAGIIFISLVFTMQ